MKKTENNGTNENNIINRWFGGEITLKDILSKPIPNPVERETLKYSDNEETEKFQEEAQELAFSEGDNEPFVWLKPIFVNGKKRIDVYPQYHKNGIKSASDKIYVRREIAEMLVNAATILDRLVKDSDEYKDVCLQILDGWRSLETQEKLCDDLVPKIKKEHNEKLKNMKPEEQERFIAQYVSAPTDDPNNLALHTTGGCIDVVLTINGEGLPVGVNFDEMVDQAATCYFEGENIENNENNQKIIKNRRLLYWILTLVGFINLSSENWHYGSGDRASAKTEGKLPIYRGVFTENNMNKITQEEFLNYLNEKGYKVEQDEKTDRN